MTDTEKKSIDERQHDQADKIITDLHDKKADGEIIQKQKKANKELLGHEGENKPEKY